MRKLVPLPAGALRSVHAAGMLVTLLLFVDDLVLISHQHNILQRLYQVLQQFYGAKGLTIKLGKSTWV